MKNKIIDSTINLINKYYHYDKVKTSEIRYGLESLYLSITKIIVVFIISLLIGVSKELLLLLIFYGLLRVFVFGAHAKNTLQCWVLSITIFTGLPLLVKYIKIPKLIMLIACIFLFFLIYKYAPAGTEKRKINNKKKRMLLKYISLFITVSYMFIITFFANDYFSKILFFSILLATIFILPLTYKLMGVKYIKN